MQVRACVHMMWVYTLLSPIGQGTFQTQISGKILLGDREGTPAETIYMGSLQMPLDWNALICFAAKGDLEAVTCLIEGQVSGRADIREMTILRKVN